MKNLISIIFILTQVFFSCSNKQKINKNEIGNIETKEFQTFLDDANVNGVILIYDSKKNKYYSNNFDEAKSSNLPASTFKISNSIIGLEAGILKNEKSVFKWGGERRAFAIWEKDLTLKEAFQRSCVPCYQELARKIGVERMNNYLQQLQFGKMEVNNATIDNFWLTGNSKITPFEQIDFLKRLYNNKLPISKSSAQIVKNIMRIDSAEDYILSGKTGLAVNNEKEVGWFVGYTEVKENVFYFATKIVPGSTISRNEFIPIRQKVTILALKKLNIINE